MLQTPDLFRRGVPAIEHNRRVGYYSGLLQPKTVVNALPAIQVDAAFAMDDAEDLDALDEDNVPDHGQLEVRDRKL